MRFFGHRPGRTFGFFGPREFSITSVVGLRGGGSFLKCILISRCGITRFRGLNFGKAVIKCYFGHSFFRKGKFHKHVISVSCHKHNLKALVGGVLGSIKFDVNLQLFRAIGGRGVTSCGDTVGTDGIVIIGRLPGGSLCLRVLGGWRSRCSAGVIV